MAKSYDFDTAVDELKTLAIDAFAHMENDGELGKAGLLLDGIVTRAVSLRDIAYALDKTLAELP
jgi:hypothetical protein